MRNSRWLLPALGLLSCAPVVQPRMSWNEAYGLKEGTPAPGQPAPGAVTKPRDEPEIWAQKFARASECEKGATRLAGGLNRTLGWSYVKSCLRRPDFGNLQILLSHWAAELRSTPEATELLAQVIAHRGGTVARDLALLQKNKVALFALSAATTQPAAYTGRPVVFLGRVENVGSVNGHDELLVVEVSPHESESNNYATGYVRRTTGHLEETGVEVTVNLKRPDPFLTLGETFLFLARFDRMARVDAQSDDDVPLKRPSLGLLFYAEVGSQGVIEE